MVQEQRITPSHHREMPTSGRKVESLTRYAQFRTEILASIAAIVQTATLDENQVHQLLNGGASNALRKHVDRETRAKFGIFFSGQRLASAVADILEARLLQGATLADPACGAGDLLLACLARIPLDGDFHTTLLAWGRRIFGTDIHEELAAAARERIALLAAMRLHRDGVKSTKLLDNCAEYFDGIQAADYLRQPSLFADADCVVMNPPFAEMDAPDGCHWSSGKVQQAAVFTATALAEAKGGQEIVAVLPDVLRSGTRYGRWRDLVAATSEILSINVFGRFDPQTDVDVFILHLRKRQSQSSMASASTAWKEAVISEDTENRVDVISQFFKVSVGTVVPHRHKNQGRWVPYIDVNAAPANGEITTFMKRRFAGTLHKGPFVAVRRTSSPSDAHRAIGTLVNTTQLVAVENHLIVLQPHDGTVKSCRRLMRTLAQPRVNDWLNAAIRCRHLTKRVISKLPVGAW